MTRIFMAFALALALFSCNHPEPQYVATSGTLLNRAYADNRNLLDSLAKRILMNEEIVKDFKRPLDTVAPDDNAVLDIALKAALEEIPFTGKLTASNFLYLNNIKNLRHNMFYGGYGRKYNFDLGLIDSNSNLGSDRKMYMWAMHQGAVADTEDSITKEGVEQYNMELKQEKDLLRDVKYLVALNDIVYIEPKVINNESFEEGVLVTHVKVYDAATGKKIAQKAIVAGNSDEVKNSFRAVGAEMIKETLVANIDSHHVKEIKIFLGLQE